MHVTCTDDSVSFGFGVVYEAKKGAMMMDNTLDT